MTTSILKAYENYVETVSEPNDALMMCLKGIDDESGDITKEEKNKLAIGGLMHCRSELKFTNTEAAKHHYTDVQLKDAHKYLKVMLDYFQICLMEK